MIPSILPEIQAVVNSILSAEADASAQVRAEEYADWLYDEFDQWVENEEAYRRGLDHAYPYYDEQFITTKGK